MIRSGLSARVWTPIYRRHWLIFNVPDYLPPSAVSHFRWSIIIGPVELARVKRDPWDYWVLYVHSWRYVEWQGNRHPLSLIAWHFGSGWRKHIERVRVETGDPTWTPL